MTANTTQRIGIFAALLLIAGTLLSGPVGLLIVGAVQPQPAWQDAQTLAANYHPIQTFPFFAGFLLVIGSGLLVAVLYQLAEEKDKAPALLAVICTAAFTGLICFNYICQTTFLPALLIDYRPEYETIITALAFANPRSLCWAIEMWGYALLGLATWLLAPIFHRNRVEHTTAALQILNGVFSIAGGLITSASLGWVMTLPGMVNYLVWNAIVVLWGAFVIWSLWRRERQRAGSAIEAQPAAI